MERYTCYLVCQGYFDLKKKVPLQLRCGHSICKKCAEMMYGIEKEIRCFCRETQKLESIEELKENPEILREMKNDFLKCERHGNIALCLDTKLMVLKCKYCDINDNHGQVPGTKETVKKFIAEAINMYFNSSRFNAFQESLFEFKRDFRQVQEDGKADQIYQLFIQIRSFLTDKFVCSKHGEQVPIITLTKTADCPFCLEKSHAGDTHEICVEWLKEVYQNVHGGSLRSFFYLNKDDILKMPLKLMYESKKQIETTAAMPNFKNKCFDCLDYFSIGNKRPVILPCSKHYMCYSCYSSQNRRIYCRFHDEYYDIQYSQLVSIDYLLDSAIKCVKDGENCSKSFYFMPCKHLICDRCYEIARKTKLLCDACELEFASETDLDKVSSIDGIDLYLDIKCEVHMNKRASFLNKNNLHGKCMRCIEDENGNINGESNFIPLDFGSLPAIEDFFDQELYKHKANYPDGEIRKLEFYKPSLSLRSKILVLKKMRNPKDRSPLNSNIIKLKRFSQIIPKDRNHTDFAWKTGKPEEVILSFRNTTLLCGIILGGDIDGQPIQGYVEIKYRNQTIYSTDVRIDEVKTKVLFDTDVEIEDRTLIIVRYSGEYLVYNGLNDKRIRNLSLMGRSVEVKINRAETRRRNDIGGPILGFFFKEYLF